MRGRTGPKAGRIFCTWSTASTPRSVSELTADAIEAEVEPYDLSDLYAPDDPEAPRALTLRNLWLELTTVLNELSRSMRARLLPIRDVARPVVKKLHFIHRVVCEARRSAAVH